MSSSEPSDEDVDDDGADYGDGDDAGVWKVHL